MKAGPIDWFETTLGDSFQTVTGNTPPKSKIDLYGEAIPLVKPPELIDGEVATATDGLSEKGLKFARVAPIGSTLVSCIGNLGKIGLTTAEVAFNQQINAIFPAPDIAIPEFVYYLTLSPQFRGQLLALSSGTTVPIVNKGRFNSIKLLLPPINVQKRIVAVLDQAFAALDRARAHAEANLADALELFDNALMATFDELLATAEMITLSEAADDFSRGKSRHRPRNDPKLYDGDYPFIQTGDIRRSEGAIREYSQTYNEAGLAQSKLWPVGTVCITIAANIAETGVLEFEACFPDSVIGMVPTPGRANAYYVEYMLRYFAKDLKLQGKGSAQDNINLATFESAKFPFPPLEQQMAVVDKLDSLATEVASLRSNYRRTLTDLANLRQSLLQKAFSGELT